jgi:hypothetical protein
VNHKNLNQPVNYADLNRPANHKILRLIKICMIE